MKEFLEYQIQIGGYIITPLNIIFTVGIIVFAQIIFWAISRFFLKRLFQLREVDVGRQYAVTQFIKYFIYILAFLMVLQSIGIKPTAILAGGAALMVGIGLGLQQTFNDLISGFILLIDGTVEVGDVVLVDNTIGTVKKISIRTTHVETRDEVVKIIPNSKLVNENVVNWNHNKKANRFQVNVGVAYGSDVKKVTDILMEAVNHHEQILNIPKPRILFKDFGGSSLDFEVFFYSRSYLSIEFVKSDIRYRITELFQQNNIEIPFPQRDLWLRNPETLMQSIERNGHLID